MRRHTRGDATTKRRPEQRQPAHPQWSWEWEKPGPRFRCLLRNVARIEKECERPPKRRLLTEGYRRVAFDERGSGGRKPAGNERDFVREAKHWQRPLDCIVDCLPVVFSNRQSNDDRTVEKPACIIRDEGKACEFRAQTGAVDDIAYAQRA